MCSFSVSAAPALMYELKESYSPSKCKMRTLKCASHREVSLLPTLTAAQRREAARAEYDAFLAACPSRQVLDRISDKWVTLILVALADGPLRYSALCPVLARVSPKMLPHTPPPPARPALSPPPRPAALPPPPPLPP